MGVIPKTVSFQLDGRMSKAKRRTGLERTPKRELIRARTWPKGLARETHRYSCRIPVSSAGYLGRVLVDRLRKVSQGEEEGQKGTSFLQKKAQGLRPCAFFLLS